jgi:hypothetical protein
MVEYIARSNIPALQQSNVPLTLTIYRIVVCYMPRNPSDLGKSAF